MVDDQTKSNEQLNYFHEIRKMNRQKKYPDLNSQKSESLGKIPIQFY